MVVEFSRFGNTYRCAVSAVPPPPSTITIPFRPCILRPAFELELRWRGTDELRGIELYIPVREIH